VARGSVSVREVDGNRSLGSFLFFSSIFLGSSRLIEFAGLRANDAVKFEWL
jgi:hypothetical protein